MRFAALHQYHPAVDPTHALGHHRRISDRMVFEHVVASLVHGSGYERIATPPSPAWAGAGITRARTCLRYCSRIFA